LRAWAVCNWPVTRLPKATLDSIRQTRLALKGPLETPTGGGYRSSNVRLREEFQLYANLRPARTIIPGGRFDKIDLVVVRENLEGLYIGHEHYVQIDDDPHAVAMATGINTRAGSRRLLEYAFEHAVTTGRKKGHHRAQGQHHEGADRHLPGNRAGAVRAQVQGQV
jgi:isocitrate dehydrogenase (NAD+)